MKSDHQRQKGVTEIITLFMLMSFSFILIFLLFYISERFHSADNMVLKQDWLQRQHLENKAGKAKTNIPFGKSDRNGKPLEHPLHIDFSP